MTNLHDRVSIEFEQHLAVVTLDRAEKYNALDLPMMDALLDAARQIRRRPDVRAVILRARGRAFCAGLDFVSVAGRRRQVLAAFLPWWRRTNRFQRLCLVWRDLPMPVIAVTHGYCFGGGLQIALGCDLRISTPDCEFSVMEIDWGLVPDMGASVILRDLLPLDRALELTWTGRRFSAPEALDLGLITRIADQPEHAARELTATLCEQSPSAISAAKRLLTGTRQGSERRALRAERRAQLRLLLGANQREAMRARLRGRKARFRPR